MNKGLVPGTAAGVHAADGTRRSGPILALEASTLAVSVALLGPDGEPWGQVVAPPDARGTSLLASAAAELLAARALRASDLLGVIVGTGPGSYTGTRAAIALARALVFAAGVRIAGVPSVAGAALAELRRRPDVQRVIVLIDARRGESYRADYERAPADGAAGPLRELRAPCLVTGADALPLAPAGAPGAPAGASPLTSDAGDEKLLAELRISVLREPHPDAYDVAAVGRAHLLSGGDSPEAVLPLYLKRSHAEIVFDERVGSQGLGGG
ncbi:MAG TPA: tRNA (adenosine(37)-N6)-threonylcarbamoyltransferase complex dimerization subunit type 1 TsaB [Planctomycetota bacterium]|nr:tRNA (adenosine(37)-N6)-threonylcarbamoyltransferase complex dimerization subunit type 1 TsaB [Planctomycetota bacterium]